MVFRDEISVTQMASSGLKRVSRKASASDDNDDDENDDDENE